VLLELPAEESFILESSLKEFQSIGFEIDPAGQRTYALRSIPAVFDQMNPQRLFREILHDISFQTERGKATETLENVLLLSPVMQRSEGKNSSTAGDGGVGEELDAFSPIDDLSSRTAHLFFPHSG